MVQLTFSIQRIIVGARSGYATSFTSHHFDELCVYLSGLGISAQHTDVLLVEIRELEHLDAVGFRAQVCLDRTCYTTGLCIDNDLLYAATGSGLRVYQRQNDGQLALYAFEVEKYEGALPDSMNPPTTMEDGTTVEGHHSANFVSVLTTPDNEKYIFVAYGQDGIRVFKLIPEPVVKGDEENEITE